MHWYVMPVASARITISPAALNIIDARISTSSVAFQKYHTSTDVINVPGTKLDELCLKWKYVITF